MRNVRSTAETSAVGTERHMPEFAAGGRGWRARTTLAAPGAGGDDVLMREFAPAANPSSKGPSCVGCVAVVAWTVVAHQALFMETCR